MWNWSGKVNHRPKCFLDSKRLFTKTFWPDFLSLIFFYQNFLWPNIFVTNFWTFGIIGLRLIFQPNCCANQFLNPIFFSPKYVSVSYPYPLGLNNFSGPKILFGAISYLDAKLFCARNFLNQLIIQFQFFFTKRKKKFQKNFNQNFLKLNFFIART